MKRTELKSIIKEVIKENLEHFSRYDEITSGDPAISAQKLIPIIDRFIGQVERTLKIAGPFLAPAIKTEAYKELKTKWESIRVPKVTVSDIAKKNS